MTKLYKTKYTLGSYADLFMSAPIGVARGVSKATGCLCDKLNYETPEFFNWEKTTQNSPTYKARQSLREKLDTEPGVKFLQSNLLSVPPFFLIGMPAAEGMHVLIQKHMGQTPEIVQYVTNSLGTLLAQMITGYLTFMIGEVYSNKQKYVNENGKLSAKKIGKGVLTALKTFLTFDLSYIGMKTAGQSTMLALGKSPAMASALTDLMAFPAYWSIAIPLGLKKGLIQARKPKEEK
ncbi:hypothetical protein HZA97_10155 [Candidatus Woesearchaeota archaeon]|nr:hypothetical protein [Candidatus Woesearchaeota archaeon]